ncbi:hypothetical protein SDC9_39026 [bioreactor metagenome]|uniref:Uncharacterized protein n=1 Tax=bioreactor metagenome TaxID=1076179 RepID=A0A644VQV6_9ZZZZ
MTTIYTPPATSVTNRHRPFRRKTTAPEDARAPSCPFRRRSAVHQQLRLVPLQRLARRTIGLAALVVLQLGEELVDLRPLRIAHAAKRLVAGLEAFGPGAIRQHHLVAVEHEVDVAGAQRLDRLDADVVDQVLRRDQHLVLLEVERGALARDQHPVVRRDHHVALGQAVAKRAGTDQHRLQVVGHHQFGTVQVAPTGPADLLDAVVAGDDLVAGLQLLDQPLALRRRDQRAGGEAGHDLLDVAEFHRAGDVAVVIQELHGAVLVVGRRVDDVQVVAADAAEIEHVPVGVVRVLVAVDEVVVAVVDRADDEGVAAKATDQRIDALPAGQRVIAGAAVKAVLALAAGEQVVAVLAEDPVVAVAAIGDVVAGAGMDGVLSGAALDAVVALAAGDAVIALAADQRVVAGTAVDRVRGRTAVDGVVALPADQRVIAFAALDRVIVDAAVDVIVAAVAIEHVVVIGTVDDIVAVAAMDRVHAVVRAQVGGIGHVQRIRIARRQPAIDGVVAGAAIDQVRALGADDDVVAVAAQHGVVVAARVDRVIAGAAVDVIGIVAGADRVIAATAIDGVAVVPGIGIAREQARIAAVGGIVRKPVGAGGDDVIALAAIDEIVARPTREHVGIVAALDRVVALAARDRVLPLAAEQAVIARLAEDRVIAEVAPDGVVAHARIDGVVAGPGQNPVVICRVARQDRVIVVDHVAFGVAGIGGVDQIVARGALDIAVALVGDHVLDVDEIERADDVAVGVEEADRAVFGVGVVIGDADRARAGEVEHVIIVAALAAVDVVAHPLRGRAHGEGVAVVAARQMVRPGAARDQVVAALAQHGVVAVAAQKRVVALFVIGRRSGGGGDIGDGDRLVGRAAVVVIDHDARDVARDLHQHRTGLRGRVQRAAVDVLTGHGIARDGLAALGRVGHRQQVAIGIIGVNRDDIAVVIRAGALVEIVDPERDVRDRVAIGRVVRGEAQRGARGVVDPALAATAVKPQPARRRQPVAVFDILGFVGDRRGGALVLRLETEGDGHAAHVGGRTVRDATARAAEIRPVEGQRRARARPRGVAAIALNVIVARAALDRVIARAAIKAVTRPRAGDRVVAAVAVEDVGEGVGRRRALLVEAREAVAIGRADHPVDAAGDRVARGRAARKRAGREVDRDAAGRVGIVDQVEALIALESVVARAAVERVVALAAREVIVARPAIEAVVAVFAIDLVIARAGQNRVVARACLHDVVIAGLAGQDRVVVVNHVAVGVAGIGEVDQVVARGARDDAVRGRLADGDGGGGGVIAAVTIGDLIGDRGVARETRGGGEGDRTVRIHRHRAVACRRRAIDADPVAIGIVVVREHVDRHRGVVGGARGIVARNRIVIADNPGHGSLSFARRALRPASSLGAQRRRL